MFKHHEQSRPHGLGWMRTYLLLRCQGYWSSIIDYFTVQQWCLILDSHVTSPGSRSRRGLRTVRGIGTVDL